MCALSLFLWVWPLGTHQSLRAQSSEQMVLLNVRVTNSKGQAVADVTQGRFQVLEDGVEQEISFYSVEQSPLTYGLLVDNSGSLRSQLPAVVRAGKRIVNSNAEFDSAFLVRFIDSNTIETVRELTGDKAQLLDGLDSLYINFGQSAVIDAVYLGADHLMKLPLSPERKRRRALIVISDGEDRNSYYTSDQLFSLLGTTDLQIYVVGFLDELKPQSKGRARDLLSRLAVDTGGRAFFPHSASELDSIADEIVNDIRTQYIIGYVPSSSTKNGFHKVTVNVKDVAGEEKRTAITRLGYTAGKH